jgi:hypothetical protein
MFEDIIKEKFNGIDVSERNIPEEIKKCLVSGMNFIRGEMNLDPEHEQVIDIFLEKHLDEMVMMYLDFYEPEELIKILEFELSDSAKKRMLFQLEINNFVSKKMTKISKKIKKAEKAISKRSIHTKEWTADRLASTMKNEIDNEILNKLNEEREEKDEWSV